MAALLLLLAVINVAVAQETPTYFKTGGELTLDLRPPAAEPITNILWKFNEDLLAEWVASLKLMDYYEPFKGRTVLDTETGRLQISKTTKAEEGVYTVEVNNKLQKVSYRAVAITKDVPKPKVETKPLSCSPASERCHMSCEADTTGTGPLTYSWKMDDGEWKEAEQKLPITKAEHNGVKTFTCRVKNPLGDLKESDPEKNPLFEEKGSGGLGGGGIAGIIIAFSLLVAGAGGLGWAKQSHKWPFNNQPSSNDTGVSLQENKEGNPSSNGDSTAVREEPGPDRRLLKEEPDATDATTNAPTAPTAEKV